MNQGPFRNSCDAPEEVSWAAAAHNAASELPSVRSRLLAPNEACAVKMHMPRVTWSLMHRGISKTARSRRPRDVPAPACCTSSMDFVCPALMPGSGVHEIVLCSACEPMSLVQKCWKVLRPTETGTMSTLGC